MEERLICCCGASGWARVIGWFEAISSGFTILILGITLALFSTGRVTFEHMEPGQTEPQLSADDVAALAEAQMYVSVALVLSVIVFISAILLLKGSYNRNPRQIQNWIIVTLAIIVFFSLGFILQLIFSKDSVSETGTRILYKILGLGLDGFTVWVVWVHKKEVEALYGPECTYKPHNNDNSYV